MRQLMWLGLLTSLFVIALLFTGFLREMAHPAIEVDPVKFIMRENATYWRMVAIEAAAYVAACAFVIWLRRKT